MASKNTTQNNCGQINPTKRRRCEEDTNYGESKDYLLEKIVTKDKEIEETKFKLQELKNKESQYVQRCREIQDDLANLKGDEKQIHPFSVFYEENKKRAQRSHDVFNKLGPHVPVTFYKEPWENPNLREIAEKYKKVFRNKLKAHLRLHRQNIGD